MFGRRKTLSDFQRLAAEAAARPNMYEKHAPMPESARRAICGDIAEGQLPIGQFCVLEHGHETDHWSAGEYRWPR